MIPEGKVGKVLRGRKGEEQRFNKGRITVKIEFY
jgi:hypothetical protein